jgi:hypothetical protein
LALIKLMYEVGEIEIVKHYVAGVANFVSFLFSWNLRLWFKCHWLQNRAVWNLGDFFFKIVPSIFCIKKGAELKETPYNKGIKWSTKR